MTKTAWGMQLYLETLLRRIISRDLLQDIHYKFLSTILPVFYLRPRDYSKSVAVAPFIVNYSGALFREYPGPWQVDLRGGLKCQAQD